MVRRSILCLMLVILLSFQWVQGVETEAHWSGTAATEAGQTVTLEFILSTPVSFEGRLQYDPTLLTLVNVQQTAPTSWTVIYGDSISVEAPEAQDGTATGLSVLSVTFRAAAVTAESRTTVSLISTQLGTVSHSIAIRPARSSESRLLSLKLENGELSPAFHPDRMEYTAIVPYHVTALDISYIPMDGSAAVAVSDHALVPSATEEVEVTVTAEDGSQRSYKIRVTVENPPGYIPSNDRGLAMITVDGFLLSPEFSPEITQYVVWLPYETESVTVSAVAADPKAKVQILGGDDLKPGQDNKIQILCTAEDGSEQVYTVIAKRAAAHGTEAPTSGTEPTREPSTMPSAAPVQIPWWIYGMVAIAVLAAIICWILQKKR